MLFTAGTWRTALFFLRDLYINFVLVEFSFNKTVYVRWERATVIQYGIIWGLRRRDWRHWIKQRLLLTSRILPKATKARLRYKRVDFLGMAVAMAYMGLGLVSFCLHRAIARHSYTCRRATKTGHVQTTLEQAKTVLLLLTSQLYRKLPSKLFLLIVWLC